MLSKLIRKKTAASVVGTGFPEILKSQWAYFFTAQSVVDLEYTIKHPEYSEDTLSVMLC